MDVKVLSREAIQRMVGRTGGAYISGGGGGGSTVGLASTAWVEQNYVSKAYFSRLFKAFNGTTEVTPNDVSTTVDNIKAMVGLWTDQYLSALGLNDSGGGGGGASSLAELSDVSLSGVRTGQVLTWNGTAWVNQDAQGGGGTGSVTSVGLTVPTGFTVAGSPVTSSGTLALRFASGYSLPTTAKQAHWDTAYGWGDHAQAGYLTQHQSLEGYATQAWVRQQGYLTQHQSLAGYATQAWVRQQGYLTSHQSVDGTFWGHSWTNHGIVSGSLSAGSSGGSINQFHAIELNSAGSLQNLGGYIDFHFNGSSADYTTRIIEKATGVLSVEALTGATGLKVGTGGAADYVQIGQVQIVYDQTNNALKIQKSDGTAAHLYATGSLSALGMAAGSTTVDSMTFGNITVNSTISVGGSIASGTAWSIDGNGHARFSRIYLDATRYPYTNSGHVYFYNGTTSIQLD